MVDMRSVTCNDCVSLVLSMLPARECPGVTRRTILNLRAKRPNRDECFCLFSEGAIEAFEIV